MKTVLLTTVAILGIAIVTATARAVIRRYRERSAVRRRLANIRSKWDRDRYRAPYPEIIKQFLAGGSYRMGGPYRVGGIVDPESVPAILDRPGEYRIYPGHPLYDRVMASRTEVTSKQSCHYCGQKVHHPDCPFVILSDMANPLYPQVKTAAMWEIVRSADTTGRDDLIQAAIRLGHTPEIAAAYADEIETIGGAPITIRPFTPMDTHHIPPPPNMGGLGNPKYKGGNYVEPEEIAEEMKTLRHYEAPPRRRQYRDRNK